MIDPTRPLTAEGQRYRIRPQTEKEQAEAQIRGFEFLGGLHSVASGALGYTWGRLTLGLPDLAIRERGRRVAYSELGKKVNDLGYEFEQISKSQWILKDKKGKLSQINPDKLTAGTYYRNLAELTAFSHG
jgi:hypothetical protein